MIVGRQSRLPISSDASLARNDHINEFASGFIAITELASEDDTCSGAICMERLERSCTNLRGVRLRHESLLRFLDSDGGCHYFPRQFRKDDQRLAAACSTRAGGQHPSARFRPRVRFALELRSS